VPEPSDFNFEMASEKFKDTNHHVLIKSRLNLLEQGVEEFA
jgi:hypothetical protein